MTAAAQDYERFYQEEISYRSLLDYPPAAHMMAVLASGEKEALLDQGMHYIRQYIDRIYKEKDLHIIGPAPAAVGKVNDIYKRVLYLKHEDGKVLHTIKNKLEKYLEINSGFRDMDIQFDFS